MQLKVFLHKDYIYNAQRKYTYQKIPISKFSKFQIANVDNTLHPHINKCYFYMRYSQFDRHNLV